MVTIAGSTLSLHAGAKQVSLERVRDVVTPLCTKTWTPIPHAVLIDTVTTLLPRLGFEVKDMAHGLWGDHDERYFGIIAINDMDRVSDHDQERQFVFGLRNSHDKTLVCGGVLGTRIFVCDNLAFSGGIGTFRFGRKHTTWALQDLPVIVNNSLMSLRTSTVIIDNIADERKNFQFDQIEDELHIRRGVIVRDTLMRMVENGAVTSTNAPKVMREFTREDGVGGILTRYDEYRRPQEMKWATPSMWKLEQAVTQVEGKSSAILGAPKRHKAMGEAILDSMLSYSKRLSSKFNISP